MSWVTDYLCTKQNISCGWFFFSCVLTNQNIICECTMYVLPATLKKSDNVLVFCRAWIPGPCEINTLVFYCPLLSPYGNCCVLSGLLSIQLVCKGETTSRDNRVWVHFFLNFRKQGHLEFSLSRPPPHHLTTILCFHNDGYEGERTLTDTGGGGEGGDENRYCWDPFSGAWIWILL